MLAGAVCSGAVALEAGRRSPRFRAAAIEHDGARARVAAKDAVAGLRLSTEVEAVPGGAIRARHTLANTGREPYVVDSLEVVFPLPAEAGEVLDFTGRQAAERIPQRHRLTDGPWLREGRRGHTGHDAATMIIAGVPAFGFGGGEVYGLHVAWSGSTVHRVERVASSLGASPDGDGARERILPGLTTIGGGELLLPGEVTLAPGESYRTPWIYLAAARDGLDGLAAQFHGYLRSLPRTRAGPARSTSTCGRPSTSTTTSASSPRSPTARPASGWSGRCWTMAGSWGAAATGPAWATGGSTKPSGPAGCTGGRIDLAMLERAVHVWTSDMTYALARQSIQRWTGQLVPPEYLGAHISAPFSQQTGRYLPLSLRCATAPFGHLGLAWDLTQAGPQELAQLAGFPALQAAPRADSLGPGDPRRHARRHRVDVRGDRRAGGGADVLRAARRAAQRNDQLAALRVPGLDPLRRYRITDVTPGARLPRRPGSGGIGVAGNEVSGAALGGLALAIPAQRPLTATVLVRAGLGGLHPGRRRPPRRRVDDREEVDYCPADDGVMQQVRARAHPELQRARLRQVRQPARRDQPAEAGRPRVDRLVPIGHGRPTPGTADPPPATAGPPPVRQPAHAGRPGQARAGPWTVRVRPGPAAPGRWRPPGGPR